jgi:pyridoxamine 5'-phosphate oxidase
MKPLAQVAAWLDEARAAGVLEPEAMALATATAQGVPSVRFVLCRGIDDEGVRFFTNYDSRKALELDSNPRASVGFFWASFKRQVRIEGTVGRLGAVDSDAYFQSRPRGNQISACVSPQSRVIASLEDLRRQQVELEAKLAGAPVPRPANWGGYGLVASRVELWTAGADRLHDRRLFERRGAEWLETRLAP